MTTPHAPREANALGTGAAPTSDPRHHEVIIVGAGFAGIGAAIRLRSIGTDFLVLEKAGEMGGVWRDNTYPDCGCDVPSALYSYSFAPNPHWSRLFAKQDEIRAYTLHTARTFGVQAHIRLNTELIKATWENASKRWHLETSAGSYTAKFLVMACGPMHVPVVPDIKGVDSFPGVSFHSSRWDHSCDLSNKRIAVIGSGASAIQFVPMIQATVQKLTLFQRTAPWVLPKMDLAISPRWQRVFSAIPLTQSVFRWLLYVQFELLNSSLKYPSWVKRLQQVGTRNIRRGIKDPQLRARVTPDFAIGCKRILMSNTWYGALAKPHVRVVPGVAEIQGDRVIASDGSICEADVIIYATGFAVANPPIAQRIVGKSGLALSVLWNGSPEAYLGTMAQDCPNLFLTFGPNLYTFSSAFVIIEAQLNFIVSAIQAARRDKIASMAVRSELTASYTVKIQSSLQRTVWNSGCTSYFIDRNGRNSTNWPWTTFYMRWRLRHFKPGDYRIEKET
jgi:cation diffusion facilitator CzcD-associated flavoprotein CzcO